jgi:hypothetical protein
MFYLFRGDFTDFEKRKNSHEYRVRTHLQQSLFIYQSLFDPGGGRTSLNPTQSSKKWILERLHDDAAHQSQQRHH